MATDVVMPQMGESIAEGTIVRWIKKVGDNVDRDEPLFEISTDKVDAEIPSPAAGVVSEIRVQEGETVPVNSVVAVIGSASATTARPAASSDRAGDAKTPEAPPPTRAAALPQADGVSSPARPAASDPAPAYRPKGGHDEEAHAKAAVPGTLEAAIRERSSPLVPAASPRTTSSAISARPPPPHRRRARLRRGKQPVLRRALRCPLRHSSSQAPPIRSRECR